MHRDCRACATLAYTLLALGLLGLLVATRLPLRPLRRYVAWALATVACFLAALAVALLSR